MGDRVFILLQMKSPAGNIYNNLVSLPLEGIVRLEEESEDTKFLFPVTSFAAFDVITYLPIFT